jgi:hypothetical protein
MSAAILGATRLAEELTRHAAAAGARAALPAALVMQAAIAAEADRPWQLAIAQDATHPTAARPPGTAGATQASRPFLASPRLMTEFFRAQALLPPGGAPWTAAPVITPSATTRDAVAQYPALAAWWDSARRPQDRYRQDPAQGAARAI